MFGVPIGLGAAHTASIEDPIEKLRGVYNAAVDSLRGEECCKCKMTLGCPSLVQILSQPLDYSGLIYMISNVPRLTLFLRAHTHAL